MSFLDNISEEFQSILPESEQWAKEYIDILIQMQELKDSLKKINSEAKDIGVPVESMKLALKNTLFKWNTSDSSINNIEKCEMFWEEQSKSTSNRINELREVK